ncbi:MAG: hypothetical protein PHQ52_08345 [Candidatus Omnitrophica bacterium]|nr:hypothetical protein [Candidatus Omnitrophota bacterium]
MKKYIEPKIKFIPLDPEQAIFEVCSVSGHYFNVANTRCMLIAGKFPTNTCVVSVRGYKGVAYAQANETLGMPS